ncbi:MAG TPA: SRPBCC domain-containing protein [Anaerolineales bacterium]|nr:SRPBCC domain-containing protein [Anaerolineales bacterium]
MDKFEVSTSLAAPPEIVYRAWLDSAQHAAFVGAQAEIEEGVGGEFRLWDGYITGRTLALDPPRRIVQAWRTTEFPDGSPDSQIEVRLEPEAGGTQITLVHTGIPAGQGPQYEEGWKENYFDPMKEYFSGKT